MSNKVELSDKELYLTWAILCWFDKPVTSTLKQKLSGMAFKPERDKYKHFDEDIQNRIIEIGKWLEARRKSRAGISKEGVETCT